MFHPKYIEFRIRSSRGASIKAMVSSRFSTAFAFRLIPRSHNRQSGPEKSLYFIASIDPYISHVQRIKSGHGKAGGLCTFSCRPTARPLWWDWLMSAGLFDPEFDSA